MRAAVLAMDGGNSKTDVALIGADGTVLAAVRGPTSSHQAVGIERGMAEMGRLVAAAAERTGIRGTGAVAEMGVYCLAGADFPEDMRILRKGIEGGRFAARNEVLNDTFAALRAGAHSGWGVVLICGQGINAAGIAPDGRTARFAGIGPLSGDWGGGGSLGTAAMGAAIRAGDGRGPGTALRRSVAAHFGLPTAESVMRAMYDGRIQHRVSELAPVVFADAEAGDAVARRIVDRLADELVTMAVALMRRLRIVREEVEVVLAGGVFKTTEQGFYERIRTGIEHVAPRARMVRLTAPPVVGAALLGLDRLAPEGHAGADQAARVRQQLGDWVP